MSGTVPLTEYATAFSFGRIQLVLDQAERCFRRQRHMVAHTLRLSSGCALIDHAPECDRTRIVPCAWGLRRDEYRWRGSEGEADCTKLRRGASLMGRALTQFPLPAWQELLPGSMADLMGRPSDLYLADYWLLVLHGLVWSGRLPYPVKARWARGNDVHDECFEFISELPTGLAEASLEALILFREAAIPSLAPVGPWAQPSEWSHLGTIEPPVWRDGRWCMGTCNRVLATREPRMEASQEAAVTAAPDGKPDSPASPPTQPPPNRQGDGLELDSQSFKIRFGGQTCRVTPRNHQLFALLQRISRRPDHRVMFDDLRSAGDVWDGLNVEDSTIRGAVARLRKLLRQHAMDALARRISTSTYQRRSYVVLRGGEATET